MPIISTDRKATMVLYSTPSDLSSHKVRFVLAEKSINANIIYVYGNDIMPPEVLKLNPAGRLPFLIYRDLVLHDPYTMVEYVEERFPHPPLLPQALDVRAKYRQMIRSIERDWYRLVNQIDYAQQNNVDNDVNYLKDKISKGLTVLSDHLSDKVYMNDNFSLVDCYMGPVLWRLPSYGLDFDKISSNLTQYAKRIFDRAGFKKSLSDHEDSIYYN